MPTIYLQVQVHKQKQILDELILLKMEYCYVCNIMESITIFTSQFILMLEYIFLFYYICLLTLFDQTHKIFSFHPTTVILHGIEVKAPWSCQDMLYPAPHPIFLEMHYLTTMSRATEK